MKAISKNNRPSKPKKKKSKSYWFEHQEKRGINPHKSAWSEFEEKQKRETFQEGTFSNQFCARCGAELRVDAKFCERCGERTSL
ncbi:MAG: zinc-ribbon domain-containing protein [Candidatus Heimdallarchaeota archaeon]